MNQTNPKLKGTYLIGAYICLLALMVIIPNSLKGVIEVAKWFSFPILILFFYINTAIDSKFEKNIFYGISLFTLSSLIPIADSVLGDYTDYIILALWIIGYFSYTRAIISITSGANTLLFKNKWLAAVLLLAGLLGWYFLWTLRIERTGILIPWICFGLATIFYMMGSINLIGQLSLGLAGLFTGGAFLLVGYNCLVGLNISSNISIFGGKSSILFYLGHLLIIFAAALSSLHFRNNDFTDIASVLKTNKIKIT